MSETERKLRELARMLAIKHGKRIDFGDHDYYWCYVVGDIICKVPDGMNGPVEHEVSISAKARIGYQAIIHDDSPPYESHYRPELYETTLKVLEQSTSLERLADV